jgi:hypothetical protein
MYKLASSCSKQNPVTVICEHSNEPFGSIIEGELFIISATAKGEKYKL